MQRRAFIHAKEDLVIVLSQLGQWKQSPLGHPDVDHDRVNNLIKLVMILRYLI